MKHDFSCVLYSEPSLGAIYLSNLRSAQSSSFLQQHNIKTVISAAKGVTLSQALPFIDSHLSLPARDHPSYDISVHFKEAIEFIERGRRYGNVLVHCMAGISRSATLVAAYLIQKHSMNAEQAVTLLQSRRSIVNPNSGFMQQLKQLQKQILASKSQQKENCCLNQHRDIGKQSAKQKDCSRSDYVMQSVVNCSLESQRSKQRGMSLQESATAASKASTFQKIERVKASMVCKRGAKQDFSDLLSSNIYRNKLRLR